ETLAALREIYDGSWTRHLGSAGGKSFTWKGKVAVLFGATEVIDAHHSVIGAMGDRFLLSRLKPVAGKKQFARALKHAGTGIGERRRELHEGEKKLFKNRRTETSQINKEETEAIGKAIALAVRLRGAVARDYRSREIEAIYGAEGTARIGLALERLLAGLDTLGMDRKQALTIVEEVALDSVPPLRRRAYDCICKYSNVETTDVAIELGLPTGSARRILEDLEAHGLVREETGYRDWYEFTPGTRTKSRRAIQKNGPSFGAISVSFLSFLIVVATALSARGYNSGLTKIPFRPLFSVTDRSSP